MRCPDCSKFVSMDNGDPEMNGLDATLSGGTISITGECRHTRNCADCGTELKEFNFDLSLDLQFDDLDLKTQDGKPLSAADLETIEKAIEADTAEISVEESGNEIEEAGGGRYQKNMITLVCQFDLTITVDEVVAIHSGEIREETSAGSYDECC